MSRAKVTDESAALAACAKHQAIDTAVNSLMACLQKQYTLSMKRATSRREMLENCIVRGTLVAGVPMSANQLLAFWQQGEKAARKPTPSEVLGPFYKKGAPNESILRKPGAPGFPLRVSGKVYNTRGDLLEAAQVDIWQADHAGRYDVVGYNYRT